MRAYLAPLTHLALRPARTKYLAQERALAPSVRLEGPPRPALVSGFQSPGPAVLCPQHPRAEAGPSRPPPAPPAIRPGSADFRVGPGGVHSTMASLRDLLRDWHQGAQAVARGDWDCALRLFSSISEPPARVSFNVGCVHLLAGDPEAALRVSQGAPRLGRRDSTSGDAALCSWWPGLEEWGGNAWCHSCRGEPRAPTLLP